MATRAHCRDVAWSLGADGGIIPVPNATVNIYTLGTTTPIAQTMYTTGTGTTVAANPLTADTNGMFEAWVGDAQSVTASVTASGFSPNSFQTEFLPYNGGP